jgi:hypothetical protein
MTKAKGGTMQEIREAVENVKWLIEHREVTATDAFHLEKLIFLASLWLSAGESLPEKQKEYGQWNAADEFRAEGFNSCHDIAQAVIARKEARIKELEGVLIKLIQFQQFFEINTMGNKFPGNDFYAQRGMEIVEEARSALKREG